MNRIAQYSRTSTLSNYFVKCSRKISKSALVNAAETSAREGALGSGMDKDPSRVVVFDTTLRDGEQSPGVNLHLKEKIQIARQLSLLGVDVCEAGFPITSNGEFEAVRKIASDIGPLETGRSNGPMVICGLSRARHGDIQRCFDAIKYAPKHRIHVFLATSDIHLQHKLKITREQCLDHVFNSISLASSLTKDVQFGAEDSSRSDKDFLVDVLDTAIEAGAKTLSIPDTVGYRTPTEYGALIRYLKVNMKYGNAVTLATHCHNDLGLATANTLAGIQNGARQIEVTINGIGERAGNAGLEEVVMALQTRSQFYRAFTSINCKEIMKTSQMVSSLTGMLVQPNKAIVGGNAFLHESGIHQDGVLKNRETYEIIKPEDIGLPTNTLVLGKHSGRHAFRTKLNDLGYPNLSDAGINNLFLEFKQVLDTRKSVSDSELKNIVAFYAKENIDPGIVC